MHQPVHECRGDRTRVEVCEFVVEAHFLHAGVDHAASHHKLSPEKLFTVVARIHIDGPPRTRFCDTQYAQQRAGSRECVGAVKPHVHVTKVINLVGGNFAVVGGD